MLNKTVKVLVFNIFCIIVSTILSFVTTNVVVNNYGSEINGIFQTANHFVNMFAFVEGGFVISAVVNLYQYVNAKDYEKVSNVISTIRYFLRSVAIWFLALGLIGTFVYVPFIATTVDPKTVYCIFGLSIANSGIIIYQSYNNAIFEANQEEYYVKAVLTFTNIFLIVTIVILSVSNAGVVWIKASAVCFSLLYSVLIVLVRKKKYPYLTLANQVKKEKRIMGDSMDVMVQKIASIINQSLDVFLLSASGYVTLASVYGVYNLIFNFAKIMGDNIAAAPVNGLGKLLHTKDKEKIDEIYGIYEFMVIYLYTFLIVCCMAVALPFIKCYVHTDDVDMYLNGTSIFLFAFVIFFNTLNRPAGYVLNYSGNFRFQRNILMVTTSLNLVLSLLLVKPYGINGILAATLLSYVILIPFNVYQAGSKILDNWGIGTVRRYGLYIMTFGILAFGALKLSNMFTITNYFMLLFYAVIVAIIIGVLLSLIAVLVFRKELSLSIDYLRRKYGKFKK